ncbi:MAG: hypothetical protein ACKVKP_12890 [Acidimicrobiales bacterium]
MAQQHLTAIAPELEAWGKNQFGSGDAIITSQSGGANNQVYLWENSSNRAIVKLYGPPKLGLSDRFIAETEFLEYANTVAGDFVPQLLNCDADLRVVAMEYIEGRNFGAKNKPTLADIQRASEFLALLNIDQNSARQVIKNRAADGFLGLTEHAENIEQRIANLSSHHLPQEFRKPSNILISNLKRIWLDVSSRLATSISNSEVVDQLDEKYCCLSPSDFGFHNAVSSADGTKFYDFEFAGWDDPAKAIADFFLQPRIRVSTEHMSLMQKAIASSIPIDILQQRAKFLSPILQVKWITIVLAVLRPQRLETMLKVNVNRTAEGLIRERLKLGNKLLTEGAIVGLP